MKEKDRLILSKINEYISDISHFVEGYSLNQFVSDKKTVSACAFTVLQMGELANRLSDELTETHADLPWHDVRGLRNRIVHNYEKIDFNVLWATIQNDLQEFQQNIISILHTDNIENEENKEERDRDPEL